MNSEVSLGIGGVCRGPRGFGGGVSGSRGLRVSEVVLVLVEDFGASGSKIGNKRYRIKKSSSLKKQNLNNY